MMVQEIMLHRVLKQAQAGAPAIAAGGHGQ